MKRVLGIFFLLLASCAHKTPATHVMANSTTATHYEHFPKTEPVPYKRPILDFYSTKDAYGEFSNFALFPVFVDEQWWPTSEHYYQAHKYNKPDLIFWVQSAPTPMEAANRGRDQFVAKRADWDETKDAFMEKAVMDKFTRYPELKALLLSTGSAKLYEHTKNDCYWGDCGDRSGKNKLGKLLEKVRASLSTTASGPGGPSSERASVEH